MAVDPSTNPQPMDPTTKLIGDLSGDYSTPSKATMDKPLGYAEMQRGRAALSTFAQSNGRDYAALSPAAVNPNAALPKLRKPPASLMRAEQAKKPAHHHPNHHHHPTAGNHAQQKQIPHKLPKLGM